MEDTTKEPVLKNESKSRGLDPGNEATTSTENFFVDQTQTLAKLPSPYQKVLKSPPGTGCHGMYFPVIVANRSQGGRIHLQLSSGHLDSIAAVPGGCITMGGYWITTLLTPRIVCFRAVLRVGVPNFAEVTLCGWQSDIWDRVNLSSV